MVWDDLLIEIRNSVTFDRFRSALLTQYRTTIYIYYYSKSIGLLLTITVHLDHVTVSAPTIRRSLGDID